MKRDVSLWSFAGFALSTLGGTLLHFVYDWSGESVWAAPFSGVNESTWEHMKLLFFPLFVFALVQSRFFGGYRSFWWVKLVGILSGLLWIPLLFYTYNGAVGPSPDWLNITIFFVAAALAFLLETHLLRRVERRLPPPWIAVLFLCVVGGLFVLFTFVTPPIPLFRDPLTGVYGTGA